ncbi:MAG: O-antigen ligase family protein [Bacteroidales bacterium]|nr:O-antigen ligase family protein [Bacteroidales bacterium]
MTLQTNDKTFRRWYMPLMIVVCLGLLCGHIVNVTTSITVFHLFLAVAALSALSYRAPLYKILYVVAGYFLVYGVWTMTASLVWGDPVSGKETLKFLSIIILVIAVLRTMLVSPRKALEAFFYVCIVYMAAMGAMGYVEHFTGWHLPTSTCVTEFADVHAASGLCYNPNDYSVLLIMAALYIFAYSSCFLKKKWHLIGFVAIGICLPLMLWNDCRTGLGVSALAILFYLVSLIKNRKITIAIIATTVTAVVAIIFSQHLLGTRLQLYGTSFVSLYDSYGIGFGINGDKNYLAELNNYNITRGLTNAHSYMLQILFTSGLPIFLLYCLMTVWIMKCSAAEGRNLFWIMPIFYLLLLFSPSSSLYLWGHYLFFCAYVCYAAYALDKNKQTT